MAIEQSILIPERPDAFKVMYEGPKPKNARQCFCLNRSERGWGLRLAYSGRGGVNQDMTPVPPPKNQPRMQTDVASQIAYQQDTLKQLESELRSIEGEKRQMQMNQQRCQNALLRHGQEANKLKITVQRADQAVDNVKAEVDKYQLEDSVIDGLRESLKDAEAELHICQEAYGNTALERDRLNEASLEKKRELDAIRTKIQEFDFSMNKAEDKIRRLEHARKLILIEKNNAIHEIEELRSAKERATEKVAGLAEQVAEFVEGATKVCAERVYLEPGETYANLGPKFERLKARVKEAARKQGGTDDEIHQAALDSDVKYQHAKSGHADLLELLAILKQSFVKRIEMYRRFQRFISARSRINFNYLLSERAFRGKLIIDHKARKLDVQVEPDETAKSGKGRQTKTLSGGEKSYSSICLLLALWEAMGAPLRCLDEFDVFMDDVNRDVSSKLIVSIRALIPEQVN
jgi:chromosome segregation ATPase